MSQRRVIFSHSGPDPILPPFLRLEVDENDTIYVVMRGPRLPAFSEGNPYACDLPGEVTTLEMPYEAFCELESGVKDYGLDAMVSALGKRTA